MIIDNTKFKHPVGIQLGAKEMCFLYRCYFDAIVGLVLIVVLFFFFLGEAVLKICPC